MSAPGGRGPSAPVELELKLEAPPAFEESELVDLVRDLGFDVGPVVKRAQVDRYLDTAELDLARRGVGLRLRESDAGACLGLKLRGKGAGADGLWQRVELELPAPRGAALPALAAALPEALRHRVEPLALARPLVEVARLATERSARDVIEPASGTRAELCLDRVRVGRD
ncbi:MAG: CYTH domain-containing protein, partial [Solirubrobacteraceae bacterium]|nr:CYTH domain-containing protein [Solirubrobacteraceae bacterium]